MPPSIRRDGAGSCATVPGQARQASFVRLVPITRNCTGITSSRSELSSPITVIGARQQGHAVSSGANVTSMRGRCAAVRAPFGRVVFAQFGILLLRPRLIFGDRLHKGFEAELKLFFWQTFGPDTELHPRQLQQQMA
jgi:hypothetical protein